MSARRRLGLCILFALVAASASAQRVRLDDSLSPVDTLTLELAWRPGDIRRALSALMAGAPEAAPPMTGQAANVEVRLDTRDFVGRPARIYRWQASGAFLPGEVRPGQSTLVFDGVIEEPVMDATFSFMLTLEGGTDADVFDVEPSYELEIQP